MDGADADHQLTQHRPVRVEVPADAFLGVRPYLPRDLTVEAAEGGFVIEGCYGFDTFRSDRFLLLVDGQQRVFHHQRVLSVAGEAHEERRGRVLHQHTRRVRALHHERHLA